MRALIAVLIAALPALGNVTREWDASRFPLFFEESGPNSFLGRGAGQAATISADGIQLSVRTENGSVSAGVSFRGADTKARGRQLDPALTRINYIVGNDPSSWKTGIRTSLSVRYSNVYPGIDVLYYENNGQIECDFVVAPGADPSLIALAGESLQIESNGDLIIHTSAGDVRQHAPRIYQTTGAGRRWIEGSYARGADGSIGFEIGRYDTGRELVIDPSIEFSTFLPKVPTAVAADAAGAIYFAGFFWPEPVLFGITDGFIGKLAPGSTEPEFLTYFGGSGMEEVRGVAVDASGNIYVAGTTDSPDFPTAQGYNGANRGAKDAFLVVFAPDGKTMRYTAMFGGSGSETVNGLAVEGSVAYVAGVTGSATACGDTCPPIQYPMPATQSFGPIGGFTDGFMAKFNTQASGPASLLYSAVFGGSSVENVSGIAARAGIAYIAGATYSADFITNGRALRSAKEGDTDAFLMVLDTTGSGSLVYSSLFGGNGDDSAAAVSIGPGGRAYIAGSTRSSNLPTRNAYRTTPGDGFVAVLDPNLSANASLLYSTYFVNRVTFRAMAVDMDGVAHLTGTAAGATEFPSTADAVQFLPLGSTDAFLVSLDPQIAGSPGLRYATLVGGFEAFNVPEIQNSEDGLAIAVDPAGNIYVAGHTYSPTFPVSITAYDLSNPAFVNRGFVTKFARAAPDVPLVPITFRTDPIGLNVTVGGYTFPTPRTILLPAGSTLEVSIAASQTLLGSTYTFAGWSNGAPTVHTITVPASPQTIKATFLTSAAMPAVGYPAPGGGFRFVPITPCRVLDTRNANSPLGGPRFAGNTSRTLPIVSGPCGVPSTVRAYSGNVTVVPRGRLGFLTIWPTGVPRPLASILNSSDGSIVSNAVIVGAGTNGSLDVYVTDETDVILDLNGYFIDPTTDQSPALGFYTVTPCRQWDTRTNNTPLEPSVQRLVPLQPAPCGIPAGASAYSFNYTAIPLAPLGYLSTWPAEQPQPLVSTLNSSDGRIRANAAIVKAGIAGGVNVLATDATHLAIDANGYFAASTDLSPRPSSLYTVPPCRAFDSRTRDMTLQPGQTRRVFLQVEGDCLVFGQATAWVVNVTVVPKQPLGYLTVWGIGQPQPFVSTLNSPTGAIVSNLAIVPAWQGIDVYITDTTDVIIDVYGFFSPQ